MKTRQNSKCVACTGCESCKSGTRVLLVSGSRAPNDPPAWVRHNPETGQDWASSHRPLSLETYNIHVYIVVLGICFHFSWVFSVFSHDQTEVMHFARIPQKRLCPSHTYQGVHIVFSEFLTVCYCSFSLLVIHILGKIFEVYANIPILHKLLAIDASLASIRVSNLQQYYQRFRVMMIFFFPSICINYYSLPEN